MIWTAFLLGFLGSMHCAGMCGPIALALRSSPSSFYMSRIFYNAGRILTYTVLGLIAGSAGAFISLAGWQQGLSITLGILLLIASFSLVPGMKKSFSKFLRPVETWVTSKLSSFLRSSTTVDLMIVGVFNGLLPCGLVYTAIAAAAVTGTSWSGAAYMSLFGVGTLPMMLAISFSGKIIPVAWRSKITRVYPYVTMIVAVLLILRGMNLGIPYISPELSSGSCSMHHK
jgi:sulfite exporter TauE/SafE